MAFVVRADSGRHGEGKFRDGKTTRKDAVEAARNLIGQGMEGVTIKDENGRVYAPAEFDAFLNGDFWCPEALKARSAQALMRRKPSIMDTRSQNSWAVCGMVGGGSRRPYSSSLSLQPLRRSHLLLEGISNAEGSQKGSGAPADVIGAAVMVGKIATGEIEEGRIWLLNRSFDGARTLERSSTRATLASPALAPVGRQLGGLQRPDAPAASWDSGRGYARGKGSAAGHAVVQGTLAARRQSARYLVHDLDDIPHDITAVAAGGALEQIANRRANLCLSIIGAGEIPIVLIWHDKASDA
jgi:hypothetical protein